MNTISKRIGDNETLVMNPRTMGPDFDKTIEELERDGKQITLESILLITAVRLEDDIKSDKEKDVQNKIGMSWRLKMLGDLASYLNENLAAKDSFNEIKII